jgi:hypothetical protein
MSLRLKKKTSVICFTKASVLLFSSLIYLQNGNVSSGELENEESAEGKFTKNGVIFSEHFYIFKMPWTINCKH